MRGSMRGRGHQLLAAAPPHPTHFPCTRNLQEETVVATGAAPPPPAPSPTSLLCLLAWRVFGPKGIRTPSIPTPQTLTATALLPRAAAGGGGPGGDAGDLSGGRRAGAHEPGLERRAGCGQRVCAGGSRSVLLLVEIRRYVAVLIPYWAFNLIILKFDNGVQRPPPAIFLDLVVRIC
jgi:hypothetical protein